MALPPLPGGPLGSGLLASRAPLRNPRPRFSAQNVAPIAGGYQQRPAQGVVKAGVWLGGPALLASPTSQAVGAHMCAEG